MTKPKPKPFAWDRQFFANLDAGVLSVQECHSCGALQFYPKVVCRQCFSRDLGWREVSGEGKVYTFTWVRVPVNPSFREEAPICLADIELNEGVRMLTRLNATQDDAVEIGADVRVRLPLEGETGLPTFDLA